MTEEFDSGQEINVEEILQQITERETRIKDLTSKRDGIAEEIEKIRALFTKLETERSTINKQLEQDRWDIRKLEKEKANAERRKHAQEEQKRLKEEYDRLTEELDELTKDCFWRGKEDPKFIAFPHQIEGGKRLAVARRGILADKRGLGKTLTGLVWLDMVEATKVLVIAPNDVVEQFEEEIHTWAPQRTIIGLSGLNPAQRKLMYNVLPFTEHFILTLNYEAWRRDKTIIDDLVACGIDSVILDEAHRIKSSDKVTARGVFQIIHSSNACQTCNSIGCFRSWMQNGQLSDWDPSRTRANCDKCGSDETYATVKNVLSMTGTPILNKPQEVFSMLYLVDPIRFPSENTFLYDFCFKDYDNRWKFRKGGLDRLVRHMSEFFVQRDRNSIGIKVPPPAIFKHELSKDTVKYPKQWKAYKDIVEAAALILESGEKFSMFSIIEMITRQRQVVTWPSGVTFRHPETKEIICQFDVEESQKVDAAIELIQELLEEGERVVVFSKFKKPLTVMNNHFVKKREFSTTTATGDDLQWHRTEVRKDFDLKTADPDHPKWHAVFATYEAFGTGINLNAARHVVLLDSEWNPGKEDQAIGRIDRLNSVDQANVHMFEVKGTIDTFMAQLMDIKRDLTEGFETTITAADLLKGIAEGEI